MPPVSVLVPLLNANEPEARLVDIHVQDRQAVKKGDLLFTIETTKAASDVEAPEAGFVRVAAQEGDTLAVGDVLAYITETVDEPLPVIGSVSATIGAQLLENGGPAPEPADLRITKP